jgi:hypothetical protein
MSSARVSLEWRDCIVDRWPNIFHRDVLTSRELPYTPRQLRSRNVATAAVTSHSHKAYILTTY